MTKKIYTQFFLLILLIIISLFLFFKYFKKSNLESTIKAKLEKPLVASENMIEDLRYFSIDKQGNEYQIEAKKGNIDKSNPDIIELMLNTNILLLGILCTAIATIIYFQILQTSGASFLSIMNFLIPLWAILFGILILDDAFSWNYILGLAVILSGIKLANSRR